MADDGYILSPGAAEAFGEAIRDLRSRPPPSAYGRPRRRAPVVRPLVGAVAASVYRATDQSVNSSTTTIINWTDELYDDATYHDTATNNSRITIPSAGTYLFGAQLVFQANSTGVRHVNLLKNGTTQLAVFGQNAVPVGT